MTKECDNCGEEFETAEGYDEEDYCDDCLIELDEDSEDVDETATDEEA